MPLFSIALGNVGEGVLISIGNFTGMTDRDPQIMHQAILETIDPAVDRELLPRAPGVVHYGGLADVNNLLQHIEFTEQVGPLMLLKQIDKGVVLVSDILNMAQPVIDQSKLLIVQGSLNTAAAVVTAHDNVLYLEDFNGVLQYRQAVQVGVHYQIGDIAVYKQFARQQVHNLIGGYTAVRAADPKVLRGLLFRQFEEEIGIFLTGCLRPLSVVFK